jgi:serine phosphatase RsbU (regulator of sigma subunit)
MSGVRVVEPGSGEHFAVPTILLVEDDHGDAVLVQACLAEAGVPSGCVTWTRTLADALLALEAGPGCVLLDLGLPDSDGFGGVNKMVEVAPDVAIIVLTGRQERDGVDALAAGAQDYLAKDSISSELLQRSIRYAMGRKRAQRTQQQLREIRLSAAEQGRLERGLLPTPRLQTDAVECSTYYRPGRDDAVLGGDFFDVVETEPGVLRAVVGDVMGHGPDEAALGVHLRVAWRTLLLAGTPDDQILPTLTRLLATEEGERPRFVTVCDVTIACGTLTVRVAGHPAPVLCLAGALPRYLDVRVGPPLGVRLRAEMDQSWPETRIPIGPGASVLLYTDGLLDAYADADALASLGIDELIRALCRCIDGGESPDVWLPTLLSTAPNEAIDDTAVVVLSVSTS